VARRGFRILVSCREPSNENAEERKECIGSDVFSYKLDIYISGISLFYNLELVKKSVFQPPTKKPGNIGPRTGKTVRITPSITVASCFEGGFATVTFPNFWNFTPLN